ncbi:MAG: sulfatase-like hydrolase/transferase [Opitutaceae bacterium]
MIRHGKFTLVRLCLFTCLPALFLFARTDPAVAADHRPNIIVIMADDMGYSDLGCYGGEIETPNLDALAKSGVRFTQFYNTARCCPTRASLPAGLYPHQTGVGHMVNDRGLDGYRGDLNRRCITIAEALAPAGCRTYMAGKWHVTGKAGPGHAPEKHNWPLQRGFDRFYGTISGAGSFYDPASLARDNTLSSPHADPEYQPEAYYYTDAISDHAARFVAGHARDHGEQPFFMYVACTAAHWPIHAKKSDIAKYRGRYNAGYNAIRAARAAKMKSLGLLDPRWQIAPQEGGAWNSVQNREFEIRCMEVYAAMIDCMDQGIGRLVAELQRTGQFEDTLILFLQDNGGCAEDMGRTRPNILFIMTDQQRFDAMSGHGGLARTPHLDVLADTGVDLRCHFTNAPVCVPSRCSMFTGRYPHTHGVLENDSRLPTSEEHLFKILKSQGYRVAYAGKNLASCLN